MRDENNIYWLWLASKFGIASKEFPKIADSLTDPYEIYMLSEEEIEQLRVSEKVKQRLCDKSLTEAYSILKYCKKEKVDIIVYSDKRYPERLRTIEDPPVLLYCKGRFPDMNSKLCIGTVGTRKMSEYGKQTAYKISYELASAGVCIVSGMARGVDGVCAVGAIESGSCTVAVLGSGISITYPKEHKTLEKAIIGSGALVTEYPPFQRPDSWNFPKRNRIISGLCQGVLVVEGVKDSGALITASCAVGQGRELFAVPGKVDEINSEGPNELIRNGANVALCAKDIIEHYSFLYKDALDMRRYGRAKERSDVKAGLFEKYGMDYAVGKTVPEPPKTQKTVQVPVKIQEEAKKEQTVKKEEVRSSPSEGALRALDDTTRRIYELLPEGTFTPDSLVSKGVAVYHAITALTMLEISGLVISLPGGMFKKI